MSSVPEALRKVTDELGDVASDARAVLVALEVGTVVVVDTRDNPGSSVATRDDLARALMADDFADRSRLIVENLGTEDGCGVGIEPCGECVDCAHMRITAGHHESGAWERWQVRADMVLLNMHNAVEFRRRQSGKDSPDA